MASVFTPITPRPAPIKTTGAAAWAKKNLFGNPLSTAATVVMIALALWLVPPLFQWAVVNAVVRPDADACQAARGVGACCATGACRTGAGGEKSPGGSSVSSPANTPLSMRYLPP